MDVRDLNPPQRQAATHGTGPLLVLAGAGSGKTRVITYRIVHLIRGGVAPRNIAALTFTNKAAAEMRHRVANLLGNAKSASELTIGTFHSLGLSMLKSERKALGFPRGFTIYDSADQMGVLREIVRRINVGGRRFDMKAIQTRISLAKNAFIDPDNYEGNECDEYDEITGEVYPRYQAALRAYAAVDFDDLITEPVRLLDSNAGVQARWREKFRYVMVDEYQDTNRSQLLLVKHLVANHGNLCVVGDDDQSIYSWRGADPRHILSFEKDFPGARVVKLEQNYRSSPRILAAANAVIANNKFRYGKELWTTKTSEQPVVCAVAPTIQSEAAFVGREIEQLHVDECRPYRHFAVLYRSNKQSALLEEKLRTLKIPYVMHGGQQFFERKEVKDVLAYLRTALSDRDEIALRRVINYPARGIGTTTVQRLVSWATANHTTLWDACTKVNELGLRRSTAEAVQSFVALIERTRSALERGVAVDTVTRSLMNEIDLEGDLRTGSASLTLAQRRLENIENLLSSLERREQAKPGLDELREYLRQLSLDTGDDDAAEDPGSKVTLTTLHGAKGLEFPVVFLIGLEEELLPHARTLMPRATDVMDTDHASDVSEERRLAYVGITRAQQRLYLTRCVTRVSYGKRLPRTPSRFLMEIPSELVQFRDIQEEDAAPVEQEELVSFFRNFAERN